VGGTKLSAAQGDALREHLISRLSGIGDVWLAVSQQDYATADRLAGEFSDDLRLLVDDLGWQPQDGDLELSTPPDVLRRAFGRLRETADSQRLSEEAEWHELRRFMERNELLMEACNVVLANLGDDRGRRRGRLSRAARVVWGRRRGRGPA